MNIRVLLTVNSLSQPATPKANLNMDFVNFRSSHPLQIPGIAQRSHMGILSKTNLYSNHRSAGRTLSELILTKASPSRDLCCIHPLVNDGRQGTVAHMSNIQVTMFLCYR